VDARSSHVAGNKPAPTEGRPYKWNTMESGASSLSVLLIVSIIKAD